MTTDRRRDERVAMVAFALAATGGIAAAVAYWNDWTPGVLGVGLAVALAGIGIGLIAWAKSLGVDEHAVQRREPLCIDEDDREDLAALGVVTTTTVGRRPVIGVLLAGSLGSVLVGLIGPLGSLGPKPRGERSRTAWRPGVRVVTSEGEPIVAADGPLDQLITAFPEDAVGRDDSQIVVLRVVPDVIAERTQQGGAVDGWIAYSKICTHAGCSVGLFGVDSRPPRVTRQLVCPCHQSVFDPLDAAEPIGGPAPRPLPQLPLAVDADGFLVATSDFAGPVGPIDWTEG